MANKVLATLYIVIYGALLVLSLVVTFTTEVGFSGIVGIVLFAWLVWRNLAVLLAPSPPGTSALRREIPVETTRGQPDGRNRYDFRRTIVASPGPTKKSNPPWAPWSGVGLAVFGLIMRFSGGGQYLAMAGATIAFVSAITLWNKMSGTRRIVLLVIPAILGPALFAIYLSIPHGIRVSVGV
jgi:hypothetical protein